MALRQPAYPSICPLLAVHRRPPARRRNRHSGIPSVCCASSCVLTRPCPQAPSKLPSAHRSWRNLMGRLMGADGDGGLASLPGGDAAGGASATARLALALRRRRRLWLRSASDPGSSSSSGAVASSSPPPPVRAASSNSIELFVSEDNQQQQQQQGGVVWLGHSGSARQSRRWGAPRTPAWCIAWHCIALHTHEGAAGLGARHAASGPPKHDPHLTGMVLFHAPVADRLGLG